MTTNREDGERLARVEVRLEHIESALESEKDANEKRIDELKVHIVNQTDDVKELLKAVLTRPSLSEKVVFAIGGFIAANYLKGIVLVLILTGVIGFTQAVPFLK
jgi:hypothetical protein